MNIVILAGRVLEESTLNIAKNGGEYVRLKVVIPRGKEAKKNNINDIISVLFWDKQAKYISEYIHKGDLVSIEARIEVDRENKYMLSGNRIKRELKAINFPETEDEEYSLKELGF